MLHRLYDRRLLMEITAMAKESHRMRHAHPFSKPEDAVQLMLNAVEPESYVRPHKHDDPGKLEVVQAVAGKIAVISYDDDGRVLRTEISDSGASGNVVVVPRGTWHSMVSLESGSVMLEIIDGPYDPKTHKAFASWSPLEGSGESARLLEKLRKETERLKDF